MDDDDADERCRRDAPGSNNPGNNLHVSGLSHRVDTRDLEQAFAKVGRVSQPSRSGLPSGRAIAERCSVTPTGQEGSGDV